MTISSETEKVGLRQYQMDCVKAVVAAQERGETRGLVVMATGLGKTITVAGLIAWLGAPRTFGLMHRDLLIDQSKWAFDGVLPGLRIGVEKADSFGAVDDRAVLASVQTVGRKDRARLSRYPREWPGLLWVDEVHHAPARSYLEVLDHFGVYGDSPRRDLPVVGTTATPDRLDELGYDKIFDDVVYRYGLRDGIRDGWLADIHAWRVASDIDLEGVRKRGGDFVEKDLSEAVRRSRVDEAAAKVWDERCRLRKNLFFCVDKAHAARVVEKLREKGASADLVVDSTKKSDRTAVVERFRYGDLQCLVGVQVFTEGFDVPECDAIHVLRPTGSGALYQQMIGRGTRRATEKDSMELFDYTPSEHDVFSVGRVFGLPDSWDFAGQSVSKDADKVEELEGAIGFKADGAKDVDDLKVRVRRDRIQLVKGALADTGLPSRFAWIRPSPSRERWIVAWRNETRNAQEHIHEKYRAQVSETLEKKGLWGVRERVEIVRNELGVYEAHLHRMGAPAQKLLQGKLFSDRSLHKLVGRAEKMIEEGRPHKMILLDKKARWGQKEASEPQKTALGKRGVPAEVLAALTRREASSLMGVAEETIKKWFSEI